MERTPWQKFYDTLDVSWSRSGGVPVGSVVSRTRIASEPVSDRVTCRPGVRLDDPGNISDGHRTGFEHRTAESSPTGQCGREPLFVGQLLDECTDVDRLNVLPIERRERLRCLPSRF